LYFTSFVYQKTIDADTEAHENNDESYITDIGECPESRLLSTAE